jgi:hypothetical protein
MTIDCSEQGLNFNEYVPVSEKIPNGEKRVKKIKTLKR